MSILLMAGISVLLIKLTVPWEEQKEKVHYKQKALYSGLIAHFRESGWKKCLFSVEVSTRGFVSSMTCLLRGERATQATIELSEKAEKASFWLWRGDRIK